MSKKGRICVPLWLATLALLAMLTAGEHARHHKKAREAEKRDDGE